MERRSFLKSVMGAGLFSALPFPLTVSGVSRTESTGQLDKPNVLFLAIDDLNDWITLMDEEYPIETPNIKRLANRGITFTRAYCASPACNPSRAATLTGLATANTGVYGNKTDWRRALPDATTLPQHFMDHGYWAEGAGKIYHHHYDNAFHDDASFHRFFKLPEDRYPENRLNGITNWIGGRDGGPTSAPFDWGAWPPEESDTPDWKTVKYTGNFFEQKHDRPFFFAAGIFRPHSPWYAPEKYFKQYPLKTLETPEIMEDDNEDLSSGGKWMLEKGKPFIYKTIKENGQYEEVVQAYQACAASTDRNVGRILDALDSSPYMDNTIVVLWTDHGFHLGEKKHWEKFALWEKSTRTPFIIVAPGIAQEGARCDSPVSLLDIYPTLIELCGLKEKPGLDGVSLVPLLKDPSKERGRPVVTT